MVGTALMRLCPPYGLRAALAATNEKLPGHADTSICLLLSIYFRV